MRVWDVPIGELDDRALLAEHRELHGLFNVLTLARKGYSQHPETLRWRGHLPALIRRHDQQVAEFKRRGWPSGEDHRTPLVPAQLPPGQKKGPPSLLQSLETQRELLAKKALRRRPAGIRYQVLEGAAGATRAMDLRMEVFVKEQKVPVEIERDEFDDRAIHVIGRVRDCVIATGRLVVQGRTGKVGRMAVRKSNRGQGLGRAVLGVLMKEARRRGLERLVLHAQCHASRFYAREGFRECSPVFLEAGIEHVEMERWLQKPART